MGTTQAPRGARDGGQAARHRTHFATAGMEVACIAGAKPIRSGSLLPNGALRRPSGRGRRSRFFSPDRNETHLQAEKLRNAVERIDGRITGPALDVLYDPTAYASVRGEFLLCQARHLAHRFHGLGYAHVAALDPFIESAAQRVLLVTGQSVPTGHDGPLAVKGLSVVGPAHRWTVSGTR
ncbi:protein of unknown function [Burkholderia multivorans]